VQGRWQRDVVIPCGPRFSRPAVDDNKVFGRTW
jgi:hypothetical protein